MTADPRRTEVEEPAVRSGSSDLSWRQPTVWLAILVAAAGLVLSVSFRITDADFWQHLAAGRAIWQLKSIPTVHLWSWPTYGAPEVNSSWGFDALIWPVWSARGVSGLFAWRWVTTLLAFGFLWAAARRMGARGLTPLFVMVLASLTHRAHSQIQPETLAGVLLAIQIWILESRRQGGRDLSPALVLVAWAWVNVHFSYVIGFLILGAYLVNDFVARPPHGFDAPLRPNRQRLAFVALAAIAVSFVNPFGWRALWQPFELMLHAKDDPLYQATLDLARSAWLHQWKTGLPVLVFGWPLLLIWRWWRAGFDAAEMLLCAVFTWAVIAVPPLTGFYALVAAPFVARDLEAVVRSVRWPAWSAGAGNRAALVSAACLAAGFLEWSRPDQPLGIALDMKEYPVRACDFIEAHEIRGRAFNHSNLGGYMAYRFWPDRERLPFMDVHLTGTRLDRIHYGRVFTDPNGWKLMDATYRFDFVLADASQRRSEVDWLRDQLDADTTWCLVFLDDAAALYLRRSGGHAALARQSEYFAVPAGEARLEMLGRGAEQDSMLRRLVRVELDRQIAASPYNARAYSMIANLDIVQRDFASAHAHLAEALRRDPLTFAAHERLGMMAMAGGRAREALKEFELERRLTGGTPELRKRLQQAKAATRMAPGRPGP